MIAAKAHELPHPEGDILGMHPILVVGAGPTGLVLALWLAKKGVPVRIIDKNSGPGLQSRAMVVQARTLELYRQLGIADEVIASGLKAQVIHLKEGAREVATLNFGDIGDGISPYPFALTFPQDDHEKLLARHLATEGVKVEWNTELHDFAETTEGVRVNINSGTIEASYLCGCDGARSTVRQQLQLGFPGGTYDNVFFVADVEAPNETVAENGFNMCLTDDGFVIVFPIRSTGHFRLIGLLPESLRDRTDVQSEDIRDHVRQVVGVEVSAVSWFSTYHVHHRVADHFRKGRVFLAGDAGHIHSPAGGQGMNTGIGDAINVAWKLADVSSGANPSILDSYEVERIAFARSLVASTDRLFNVMVGRGAGSHLARELLPHVAPFMLGFTGVRRAMFGLVSQVRIQYHESMLSAGAAGDIRGGDRLPWVENADNFAPLTSMDWQVHVYGETDPALTEGAKHLGVPVHTFPWTAQMSEVGFEQNAMYLVRPDGYVALADLKQDVSVLEDYWHKLVRK